MMEKELLKLKNCKIKIHISYQIIFLKSYYLTFLLSYSKLLTQLAEDKEEL